MLSRKIKDVQMNRLGGEIESVCTVPCHGSYKKLTFQFRLFIHFCDNFKKNHV